MKKTTLFFYLLEATFICFAQSNLVHYVDTKIWNSSIFGTKILLKEEPLNLNCPNNRLIGVNN